MLNHQFYGIITAKNFGAIFKTMADNDFVGFRAFRTVMEEILSRRFNDLLRFGKKLYIPVIGPSVNILLTKKKKYIPLGPLCTSVKRLFTFAGTTRHSVDKPYISVCRQQFEAAFVHFKERFMILGHFNIIYETEFLYIT